MIPLDVNSNPRELWAAVKDSVKSTGTLKDGVWQVEHDVEVPGHGCRVTIKQGSHVDDERGTPDFVHLEAEFLADSPPPDFPSGRLDKWIRDHQAQFSYPLRNGRFVRSFSVAEMETEHRSLADRLRGRPAQKVQSVAVHTLDIAYPTNGIVFLANHFREMDETGKLRRSEDGRASHDSAPIQRLFAEADAARYSPPQTP